MKDEFLATVSHELRTPLNAILGWAAHAAHAASSTTADRERGLETIERNAHAQAQLIDDLLDVSRIITGKLRLELAAGRPRRGRRRGDRLGAARRPTRKEHRARP